MLLSLRANKEEFQAIDFVPGFNIVIAERAPGATDQHSRNARGKSSIIQAINYCLGSNLPASFRGLAADGWAFTLSMELFGEEVAVTRNLRGGTKVEIERGAQSNDAIWSSWLSDDGSIRLADWKELLGLGLFRLDPRPADSPSMDLSARTLISYVVRQDTPRDPTKILAQQSARSSREHVAFLLGLDWQYTRDLAEMEREKETYEAIQYASQSRLLPSVVSSEPDLLIERAEAQARLDNLRSRNENFVVLEDPGGLVATADRASEVIRELRNESVLDSRLIALYEDSLAESEGETDSSAVRVLYEEVGRTFTDGAVRRFEDVSRFHQLMIENRHRFLSEELERLREREQARTARMRGLNDERNSILRQLNAGGALEELLELQRSLAEAENRLRDIERSLAAVREISTAQEALRVRKAQSRQEARIALEGDREHLDRVAVSFDSMMQALYGRNGVLTVGIDDLGYKFSITVAGSASSGITKMKLLCFDLTLMAEGTQGRHPRFLVHDSPVYDGVDPRQTTAALRLAQRVAHETGGQYLLTLNSNDVPEELESEDWFKRGVRRTVLDTELGGAFGVEF